MTSIKVDLVIDFDLDREFCLELIILEETKTPESTSLILSFSMCRFTEFTASMNPKKDYTFVKIRIMDLPKKVSTLAGTPSMSFLNPVKFKW